MRRPASLLAFALATACSRDLSVPTVQPVTISPAIGSVAPRETLTLSAAGGAGGYRFAFDGGQRPSGDDAALDADTGAYRAGSRGSAQDVVVVTDAAGSRAVARIAVGPRLVVTPAAAVTSPGGQVEVVASGGKPPYAFTLLDAQPATTLAAQPGEASATYEAGPLGDRTERVLVTDATWDAGDAAAASAACEVRIGSAVKIYANAADQVAPFETLDFLAVGGQPPYAFDFANRDGITGLPPSGGSIDATTGRYEAGPAGTAPGAAQGEEIADEIVAVDGYGQASAPWRVVVGPPLALSLADAYLSPGRPVQLSASGGKPPYQFGFAARGNRSRGSVDGVTGVYVPGPGQGTWDVLAVTDATGRAQATVDRPPTVGFQEIAIGDYGGLVLPARLRGDMRPDTFAPRQDALVFHYADGGMFTQLTSLFFPAASPPLVSHGYLDGIGDLPFVLDVDDDDHDDVVAFTCQPAGKVSTLLADVSGGLAEGPSLALGSSNWWYLAARSFSSLWSERKRFYTTIGCNAGLGPDTGITVVDANGATGFATSCLPHPDAALLADVDKPFAAADLDGDATVDLAWVEGYTTVKVSYRPGGVFQPALSLAAPAGCWIGGHWFHWSLGALVPYEQVAGSGKVRLAVALSCGSGVRIASIAAAGGVPAFDPAGGVTVASGGLLAAYRPAPDVDAAIATWSSSSDHVRGVRFDGPASAAFDLAPPLPMTVQWAGFPDVDGDGTPDLLAVGDSLDAYLMLGDGDGRFGMKARVRGLSAWAPAGDLDGDTIDDVVVATHDRKLAVLLGGADQLAWGPPTPLASPVGALVVGDFFGTGTPAVTYQDRLGAFYRATIEPDLGFGTPQKVAFGYSPSPREDHRAADLGGVAPGPDVWWLLGEPSARSYIEAAIFDTPTTAHIAWSPIPDPYWGCGILPSGLGSFRTVAVCPDNPTPNGIVILTSNGGSPYTLFTGWSGLPGGSEANAAVVAAGRHEDGAAVFVATPSGPKGIRHRYAVTVTRNPLAARVQDLGTEAEIPADRALLADVDGDGANDIVVTAKGKGRVLLGTGTGDYALGPSFRGAGVPSAALHLDGSPGADLLMTIGDDLVVVPHAGAGQLE